MKKIFLKIIELIPFFSVLVVLGFVGYWQVAQYNKIEQLELRVVQYHQQFKLFLTQKSSLEKGMQSVEKSTKELNAAIKQLQASKTPIVDNNDTKEKPDLSLSSHDSLSIDPINAITVTSAEKTSSNPGKKKIPSQPDSLTDKQLTQQLKICKNHLNANRLTRGSGGNAYDCYLSIFKKHPENNLALKGINQIETKYEQTIKKYIAKNNIPKAQHFLDILIRINPQNKTIKVFQEKLQVNTSLEVQQNTPINPTKTALDPDLGLQQHLEQCKIHLDNHRLTYGEEGNAFDCYSSVLNKHPENKAATIGLLRIERRYERYIKKYINNNNLPKAQRFVATLTRVNPQNEAIESLQKKLDEAKNLPQADKNQSLPAVTIETAENIQQPEDAKTLPLESNKTDKLPEPVPEQVIVKELVDKPISEDTTSPTAFIKITAGCFKRNVITASKPICIKNNYQISKYEVTQQQWQEIMKKNPSRFIDCGANCPVENVSWFDVQEFIRKLNNKTGKQYRLPTDDEWEYAARAGNNSEFSFGNNPDQLAEYGNYCDKNCTNDWQDKNHDDGVKASAPVGTYKANNWGLHDFHGNVWEWVSDKDLDKHIYRGGSWGDSYELCQSSSRGSANPDFHVSGIGFRLVLN
ncbi:MAG: formylglycine-generating enzyme family protein [Pseudomonadota bacterium]